MNVVFDLGGVVVAWNPEAIVASAVKDPALRPLARREIIDHPDWLAMDRGTLSLEEAVRRGTARSGLPEPLVRFLIESVAPSLVANPETVALMRRVRDAGHRLYCLSNMPVESMAHLEATYDFWNLFSGIVISARIGHCKPEPAIYEHLLETYDLVPHDTIFVDDMQPNLDAAASFGIRTIRFRSVAQCSQELSQLGAL
jgi:putative hydrolase of the HAD superfamily